MENIFDLVVGIFVVFYYLFKAIAFFTKGSQTQPETSINDLKITAAELDEYLAELKSIKVDINDLASRQGLNELVYAWIDLLNMQINEVQALIVAKAEVTESTLSKSTAFPSISPIDLFAEYRQFKEVLIAPDFIELQTHRRSLFYFTRAPKHTFYLRHDQGFEFLWRFAAFFNRFHFVYEEESTTPSQLLNVIIEDLKHLIHESIMGTVGISQQMLLSKKDAKYLQPTPEQLVDAYLLIDQIDLKIRKPYTSGKQIHWDIDEAMQFWTEALLENAFQLLVFKDNYLNRLLKDAQSAKKLKCHELEDFPLRLKLEFAEQLIIKLKLTASFQGFIAQKKKLALGPFEYIAGGTQLTIPISVFMPFFEEWLNRFYKCKFQAFNAHTIENIKWNVIHDTYIKPILIKEANKQAKKQLKQLNKKQRLEALAPVEDAMSIYDIQEDAPLDLSHLELPQESDKIDFIGDSEVLNPLVDHYQISPMAEAEAFDFSIEEEDELRDQSKTKAQELSLKLLNTPTTKQDLEFVLAVGEIFMKKKPKHI